MPSSPAFDLGALSVGHTWCSSHNTIGGAALSVGRLQSEETVEKSEWIWMNGDLVPWDDAKVHVLSHGLHYGTRRVRGHPLLRDRSRPGRLPAPRPPRSPHELGGALLPVPASLGRGAPGRDSRADPAQRPFECYIRPIAFRGYGEMGLLRAVGARGGDDRRWPWGAYLGEEGKRNGMRAKVSSWRRISPDGLIPEAKASRPVPELDSGQDRIGQGRIRRGDPAGPAWLRLRRLGREHLRRPRRPDPDPAARRLDPRRDQPQVGRPDRARPRLHGRRARHRPRRALPGRGGLPDRNRRRAGPCAGDRRPRPGRARRDHACDAVEVRGRPARARAGVPRMAGHRRATE